MVAAGLEQPEEKLAKKNPKSNSFFFPPWCNSRSWCRWFGSEEVEFSRRREKDAEACAPTGKAACMDGCKQWALGV